MKSFASSADWIKSLHFGDPKPTADPGIAAERSSKRRKLGSYTGPEPTIDEIEGEFWRVIEAPDDVRLNQLLRCGHRGCVCSSDIYLIGVPVPQEYDFLPSLYVSVCLMLAARHLLSSTPIYNI